MKPVYRNGFRYVGGIGYGMHPLAWHLGYYLADWLGVIAQFMFAKLIWPAKCGWYREKWFWKWRIKKVAIVSN